jgi:hypothetical protein
MSERFDELSRAMGEPRSRRGVLKLFGAAAVAAVTTTVLKPFRADAVTCAGPTSAGAAPCGPGTTPCGPCCCKAGIACQNSTTGVCGCPAGTTPCGNACCKAGVACASAATATCNGPSAACLNGGVACGKGCCAPGKTCTNGSCGFVCPPQDNGGFPLEQHSDSAGVLFCSYPVFSGENPNDFYCRYNDTTGALVEDNDAGLCPGTAST